MTLRYEALSSPDAYADVFKVPAPHALGERRIKPRQPGYIVRLAPAAPATPETASAEAAQADPADAGPAPDGSDAAPAARELLLVQWGLVPHWVKSASDGRLRAPKLVNARSETVTTSTPFRDAWLRGQRCIVPMQAFYVDDLRGGGKPLATRIARIDGAPMGVAGLWACWTGPEGETLESFTLLTVNANSHALLHRYGQPGSEKRMPAILSEGAQAAWLTAPVAKAAEFMRAYPAQSLTANPVETKADKRPKGWLD
jgi:putative SOS response-associated peptidase YedK